MGTTTTGPNNAGYGLLGAGVGALPGIIGGTSAAGATTGLSSLLPLMMASDPALKENIEPVGKLDDGQTVHRFNYKGDPTTRIGLMSTEVAKKAPEAVDKSGVFDMVDYRKATDRAAAKAKKHHAKGGAPAMQFGLAA